MHNLYLIVGRTASGKDSLTRAVAEKYNLKILSSYATRPKRPGETDEHIFITSDEVDKYKNDIIAYTKIGNYEYFSTKQQLFESDFYIIDPNGVKYLRDQLKNIDEITLHIIYIFADYEVRKNRAINKRKDNISVFETRCVSENEQFDKFEKECDYNKLILNVDYNLSFLELENYIITNNNLEELK